MSLSQQTVDILLDLVEIKISYMDVADREDARDLQAPPRPPPRRLLNPPHPGTRIPRATAGRSEIAAYQRATAGNSLRSTLCHSWRATHGYVATSAIE